MIKKTILLLIPILVFVHSASTQNQTTYPIGRMESRADSLSRITDSLIASQKFFHFVVESKYKDDTTIYYRHYYIDTLNRYLLKCVIDTTFDDYYKRTFRQVVIYFNQGYEFKNCYNEKRGIGIDNCSYYNIFLEENEIAQQPGKLNENWTERRLDEKIKDHVSTEIWQTKFMQKRNYN
jgi:hypothetical protein